MMRLRAWLKANSLRVYGIFSLCMLVIAYGMAVGALQLFPYGLLQQVAAAGVEVVRYPKHTFRIAPEKFLAVSDYEGDGAVLHVGRKASPGSTFIVGFFDGKAGMRLIGLDGSVIHEWRVSFNEIWPEAAHLDRQPHDWDTEIHGALLYPTGDVVFNFQYRGLVRIDRCSRVKWRLARETHHSVFEDADGNLWVPDRKMRDEALVKFPGISPPFQEEFLLKISPDGDVLEEISILDVIFQSGNEGLLFANGTHGSKVQPPRDGDFTHMNEIEVLSPSLAKAFPEFAAGDLLVSMRNLNLLLVLDPKTKRIKWSTVGRFLRQHDPDFLPSGRISVFDNRRDGNGGKTFGGSRIREIDPGTGATVTLYGGRQHEFFYTEQMGENQWLANGNVVITEANAGRALEVSGDREVVWSYINRWSDDSVGRISQATRYPESFFSSSALKEGCDD